MVIMLSAHDYLKLILYHLHKEDDPDNQYIELMHNIIGVLDTYTDGGSPAGHSHSLELRQLLTGVTDSLTIVVKPFWKSDQLDPFKIEESVGHLKKAFGLRFHVEAEFSRVGGVYYTFSKLQGEVTPPPSASLL